MRQTTAQRLLVASSSVHQREDGTMADNCHSNAYIFSFEKLQHDIYFIIIFIHVLSANMIYKFKYICLVR